MSSFVHLHVHSHYSLLDGLGKIDELVNRAKELEMSALALTDHGNMHGAIEFYMKCKKAGIKPILGVEAYLAPRGMLDKVPKVDSTAYHQVLLAKDEVGYRNLLFLVSEAHAKGMYYKPRIDLDLLAKHSKGLIGTSSCLAGMVPEAIAANDMEKAISLTKRFQDIFEGDFFLEMQHHPSLEKQIKLNEGLKVISKELGIPLIATSDVHYIRTEDKETQEVLLAINTGKDLSSDDRMTFGDVDVSMQTEDYFKEAFADTPEVIANTAMVADKCNLELKLGESILPDFDVPEGFTTESYLEHLCQEGLKRRYGDPPYAQNILERLEFEMGTIKKMGFPSYFLIVADFVNWAKSQGIYCGPRGSAAGSLVSYLIGICDMDPIEYGYLFERFLNPDRISMPDIDIDFADDRRDEVIRYVTEKYGADHVAGIATFGTMMGRAAVRDVGRVLGLAYSEVDEIAKLVPPPVQGRHVPLKQSLENVPEIKQRYESDPRLKKLLDLAVKLEGTVRHASQHACAFVICKEPTIHYTPVQPAQRGREGLVTQFSMKPIEEIGLLKMDFLGLANWSIMRNAVRIIRKVYGEEIDVMKLPLDDKPTYELLSRAETTGVFQLESDGMKRYIKELKPTNIYDIMAMVSLYRPGPMQNITTYIERKHGREKPTYLHTKMENSLGETFGIPIYQEQVMQGTKDLAGFTGGEADTVRKAMGKKIASLMAEMKIKFIAGCKTHSDIEEPLAEKIWRQYEDFAEYGFNKSHAGCYAWIAYQTAYLKAHYPAAFFAALLTNNTDDLEKMSIEMAEAEKMGIKILPPDVNESFPEFGVISRLSSLSRDRRLEGRLTTGRRSGATRDDGLARDIPLPVKTGREETLLHRTDIKDLNEHQADSQSGTVSGKHLPVKNDNQSDYIRFGLAAIKGVGQGVSEKIVEERKSGGPFVSITDFLHRLRPAVLNKRVLEAMAMTGALDRFGERNSLVQSVEVMIRFLASGKKDTDQMGLFGTEQMALVNDIALMDVPPAEKRIQLEWEKLLLGIYLTGHPLKEIEPILPHIATPIRNISATQDGQNQRVGGMITELRQINTKNNEAMAFAKLDDPSGTIELVIFPRTWGDVKLFCQPDRYIVADGRVDTRDGSPKIIVSRIMELHPQESVGTIKAALGPIPKVQAWQKKRDDAKKATESRLSDASSSRASSNETRDPGASEPRLLMKLPSSMSKKALEEVRFLLQSHVGNVPVYIETMRGQDFTLAKTKSAIKPSHDLLLLLKQAGVNATLEGMETPVSSPRPLGEGQGEGPDTPGDFATLEVEEYIEEPEMAVS